MVTNNIKKRKALIENKLKELGKGEVSVKEEKAIRKEVLKTLVKQKKEALTKNNETENKETSKAEKKKKKGTPKEPEKKKKEGKANKENSEEPDAKKKKVKAIKSKKSHPELEKILAQVRAEHVDSTDKKLFKALGRATQQYYSQLKKKRLQNKAPNPDERKYQFLFKRIEEKWCPRTSPWWDRECEGSYNSIYLLAAMQGYNIEKGADKLLAECPQECDQHLQLLDKKRLVYEETNKKYQGSDKRKKLEAKEKKKKASKIEKTLKRELKAKMETCDNKTEEQLIKEIIAEKAKRKSSLICHTLRQGLNLADTDGHDKELKDAYQEIEDKAKAQKLDITSNAVHLKRFKKKNSALFKKYFELIAKKKVEQKLERKAAKQKKKESLKPKVEEGVSTESGENKKIKFEDSD